MQQEGPGDGADVDRRQETGDYPSLVDLDLSLKVQPRSVPNPLHAPNGARLRRVRHAVRDIVAARQAGPDRLDGDR